MMTITGSAKRRTIALLLAVPAVLCAATSLLMNILFAPREISDFVEVNQWRPLAALPEVPRQLLFDRWRGNIWLEGVSGTYYQHQLTVTTDGGATEQWVATSTTSASLYRCDDQPAPPPPNVPPPDHIYDSLTCRAGLGDQMVPVTYALLQDSRVWRIIHPAATDRDGSRLLSVIVGALLGLCGGGLLLGVGRFRARSKT